MHQYTTFSMITFVSIALQAIVTVPTYAAAPFVTLHTFTGADGANPQGGVTPVGSILYGTTIGGGTNDFGAVYRFDLANNSFTTLHSFVNASEGNLPANPVLATGTALYGANFSGGPSGAGTVYNLDLSTNAVTILHSFSTSEVGGAYPATQLTQVGSTLYGTTQGINTRGNIFSYDLSNGTFASVHNFAASEGSRAYGSFVQNGSILYGTASQGGANSRGSIYSLDTANNVVTILHSLTAAEGSLPRGNLIQYGSQLIGTTSGGHGSIFSYDPVSNVYSTLYTFSGSDGNDPGGQLSIIDSKLYGTTASGGSSGVGTVYSFNLLSQKLVTLHTFTGGDGSTPYSGLSAVGSTLYGTTFQSSAGSGTLFAITVPEPSTLVLAMGSGAIVLWRAAGTRRPKSRRSM